MICSPPSLVHALWDVPIGTRRGVFGIVEPRSLSAFGELGGAGLESDDGYWLLMGSARWMEFPTHEVRRGEATAWATSVGVTGGQPSIELIV